MATQNQFKSSVLIDKLNIASYFEDVKYGHLTVITCLDMPKIYLKS